MDLVSSIVTMEVATSRRWDKIRYCHCTEYTTKFRYAVRLQPQHLKKMMVFLMVVFQFVIQRGCNSGVKNIQKSCGTCFNQWTAIMSLLLSRVSKDLVFCMWNFSLDSHAVCLTPPPPFTNGMGKQGSVEREHTYTHSHTQHTHKLATAWFYYDRHLRGKELCLSE